MFVDNQIVLVSTVMVIRSDGLVEHTRAKISTMKMVFQLVKWNVLNVMRWVAHRDFIY